MSLSDQQLKVIESPLSSSIFLSGPAGTGKTTAGVNRLNYLLESGVRGQTILLFFPQRNLGSKYQKSISDFSSRGFSLPVFATYGGLARRILDLFWPVVIDNFPALQTALQPTFLTLESSLYFLSRIVEPLINQEGYFSNVVIQRNRLYSQILDNLNKSAVHAFPHTEIAERLRSSWIGDPSQLVIYEQAQQAANQFREYCYQNNLLDYSLQIELFTKATNQIPLIQNYLSDQYDFLIYDNSEEDVPVAHDFIRRLIPQLDSILIIHDQDAGYRNFLGASPLSAHSLSDECAERISFLESYTTSPSMDFLNWNLSQEILGNLSRSTRPPQPFESVISINYQTSYPGMTDWVAEKIRFLIDSGESAGEIAILAPYLSDSLRFLLFESLSKHSLTAVSHRPSRALRDEPATQALLTAAALAHPSWEIYPTLHEIALAFVHLFKGLDLTRAFLLARQAIKNNPSGEIRLADFDLFSENFQNRITFYYGNLYQQLLNWLNSYTSKPAVPLDHFLTHIFGEILSRPGYGFHNDLAKGRVASQIIESVSKFRQSTESILSSDQLLLGREYYQMVKTGVLANQYIKTWTDLPENEIYISPAYTFLLNNKPVDYQFWLDIGSRGWFERIYQPLTNPHILHRNWPQEKPWNDDEEQSQNIYALDRITTGLMRRCRKSIFGCLTETDERGFDQKGELLIALNKIISNSRQSSPSTGTYFDA
jgi:hypothetical protein